MMGMRNSVYTYLYSTRATHESFRFVYLFFFESFQPVEYRTQRVTNVSHRRRLGSVYKRRKGKH